MIGLESYMVQRMIGLESYNGPEYDRPGIIYGPEYDQPGIIKFLFQTRVDVTAIQTKIFKY